jgi:hypothetical protein
MRTPSLKQGLHFFAKIPKHVDYYETIQHLSWVEVMQQKYNSIVKNGTWDLGNLLEGKTPIITKWV